MRTIVAGATLALASILVAPAAHAAPSAPDVDPYVDQVVWVVKCAGDALGGNACHG